MPTVEGGSYLDFALKLLQQLKCLKLLEQSWTIINLYDCYSYKQNNNDDHKTYNYLYYKQYLDIIWTGLILLYENYKIMN